MTGVFRGVDGVQKLLEIARSEAETVRIDLIDIDSAKMSAKAALAEIADSVAREVGATGDPVAFAAYAETLRERRVNLKKTLNALENAEAAAKEKLSAARGEIAKLERLVEINIRDGLGEHRRRRSGKGHQGAVRHTAAS